MVCSKTTVMALEHTIDVGIRFYFLPLASALFNSHAKHSAADHTSILSMIT